MGSFWPHDAIGWLTIVVPTISAFGWILNEYFKKPLNEFSKKLDNLQNRTDLRLDDHERRIQHIEDTGDF